MSDDNCCGRCYGILKPAPDAPEGTERQLCNCAPAPAGVESAVGSFVSNLKHAVIVDEFSLKILRGEIEKAVAATEARVRAEVWQLAVAFAGAYKFPKGDHLDRNSMEITRLGIVVELSQAAKADGIDLTSLSKPK